jgi:hypothetical protein
MIDTGAAVNIIKLRCLHPSTRLDTQDITLLSGITAEKIQTRGSVVVYLYGHPVTLHVVPNDFPISQEGILGVKFLQYATKIEFLQRFISWQRIDIPFAEQETVIIPARSRAPFHVKVINSNIKEAKTNTCQD